MSKISEKTDWNEYYKNKSNQTPRDSLLKALEFIASERTTNDLFAMDIGCGHGADTIELLKQGWKVYAIDSEEAGLKIINESIDEKLKKNLKTKRMTFEEIELEECDLLNASYSLPFCKPEHFEVLWNKIQSAIKINGYFSGQLFGVNDSWAVSKVMNFHRSDVVKNLFDNFEIKYFEEKDEDGLTALGESKHWHVFSVVARKLV